MPPSVFTPRTVSFLRALKRHNDREWFRAHRDEYERDVRAPMTALVERLAIDMHAFAPELIATPRASLFRIYRDTRFSADKSPFKTNAAARFPCRGLDRGAGAGLYLEVAPRWVWVGGGFYAPEPRELRLVRAHLAAHWRQFARIVDAPAFTRTCGALQGARLQRVPRGYDGNHPAAEYLKYKQLYAGCERPASFAHSSTFYRDTVRILKTLLPLVRFLNAPLLAAGTTWNARGPTPTL